MYTAIRLYFTHDLTCQLNPFLNDFLSDSVEIIPGAFTKTKKNENIGFRDTFKRMLIFFFSLYLCRRREWDFWNNFKRWRWQKRSRRW